MGDLSHVLPAMYVAWVYISQFAVIDVNALLRCGLVRWPRREADDHKRFGTRLQQYERSAMRIVKRDRGCIYGFTSVLVGRRAAGAIREICYGDGGSEIAEDPGPWKFVIIRNGASDLTTVFSL
jgi:hypothetical protein